MREKVRKTIAQFHMFPQKAKLIVGLSGGADSVALLHLLCGMKEEFQWDITAVHVHHGLRGKEADEDARFAEGFCASLGIPCIVKEYDVAKEAGVRGLGEEETGRILRYAAFREAAGEGGRIAVAHHQKDQAETMLMRLCRGTGLTGLAGMSPVRENICRPLLFCSREEIEQYCRENHLDWREDATNSQEKYTRNKLRLKVLPVLQEINPKAVEHMAETASLLGEEEDFLEQQALLFYEQVQLPSAVEEVHLHREKLKALHHAMRRRVLRKAMAHFLKTDVSQAQIKALEDLLTKETGKSRDFLEGIRAENRYEALVLSLKKEKAKGYCYHLPMGEEVLIWEAGIAVMLSFHEKFDEISEETCTKVFDYDKIKKQLFCRTRQTGDFIRLKNGRKKIKDRFIDEKIPRKEREAYPLIAMGEEVLWAPNLRSSEACKADEQTIRCLWIRIRRVQE
ncbi:tRNA lysidine(34) synthetase TilS [Anaerotignum sp.]|nr:tRNA lysidine(34) synthetase TilS [Anaerotignum sp.]MBQ7758175.1 tRNA lysidine(34) synthetase TilS [Anaerotignum sp.]